MISKKILMQGEEISDFSLINVQKIFKLVFLNFKNTLKVFFAKFHKFYTPLLPPTIIILKIT